MKALKTDAEARGIGSSTLNRAADALDVIRPKEKMAGGTGRYHLMIDLLSKIPSFHAGGARKIDFTRLRAAPALFFA